MCYLFVFSVLKFTTLSLFEWKMVSDQAKMITTITTISLNPCLSGRWSLTTVVQVFITQGEDLNPCLSGRWALTSTLLKWLIVRDLEVEGPRVCPKKRALFRILENYKRCNFWKNRAQSCSKFQYHSEWKYINDRITVANIQHFLDMDKKNRRNC